MTLVNTDDIDNKVDVILKKAWEHGYYSNNYPSDPNMTWFSDDKQSILSLLEESNQEARTKVLEQLPITGIIGMNGRRTDCVLASEVYNAISINKIINQLTEASKKDKE